MSIDIEALQAIKQVLNEEIPPPSRQSLAATHTRFARLLARQSVQKRFQQAAKLSPQAAFDLELNMGERIGPRT